VERRQSPKGERRQSPQDRPRYRGQREASPEKKRERYVKEDTKYAPSRTTKTGDGAENFRIGKPCTYCGRKHENSCKLTDHPDANKDTSIPWLESAVGRDMSKAGYGSSGLDFGMRWDATRKELVPLGKAAGRHSATDKHR
jgi:hypothetical protein